MTTGADQRIRNAYEKIPYAKTFSELEEENLELRARIVELEGLLDRAQTSLSEAVKQVNENSHSGPDGYSRKE